MLILVAGWSLTQPTAPRITLAAAVAITVVGLVSLSWRASLYLLVPWLAALGLVRRLTTEVVGPTETDPLLLVSPLLIALLALHAVRQGAFENLTPLSHCVLILSGLSLIGAANPLQGGGLAGVGSLLFILVPISTFWIGRALCDDHTLAQTLKIAGVVAVPCALYGLLQVFSGFPSWDATWIRDSGYTALNVFTSAADESSIRPFSTFSSAAEFGYFMAIAFMIWLAFWMRGVPWIVTMGSLSLFVVAIALESSRGIVVVLVLSIAVMLGARQRLPGILTVVLALLSVAALSVAVAQMPLIRGGEGGVGGLVTHQVEGLQRPLDPDASSLVLHLTIVRDGLESVTANPLGVGLSAVTLAGQKLGDELNRGTEADISNAAVGLGLPGLLIYVLLVVFAFRASYRVATIRGDALGLLGLGIITVTVMQWLNGGQYAVAFLPWLILGWVDRQTLSPAEEADGDADTGTR